MRMIKMEFFILPGIVIDIKINYFLLTFVIEISFSLLVQCFLSEFYGIVTISIIFSCS